MSEEEIIMSGEEIMTEFIQGSTGFRIVESDLTTGKVVINDIEITSIEDWNKVTYSIVELQQENSQLKEEKEKTKYAIVENCDLRKENSQLKQRIEKAIEYIEIEGEHTDCSGEPIYYLDEEQEEDLLKILKGDKE